MGGTEPWYARWFMAGARVAEQLPRQVGRYVLHHQFASGGMAAVYFGQLIGSVGFSRVVAIKRMHEQFVADQDFVRMFVDEAWLAARVQHPNVVQTVDVVADAGELFIVLDYVRGEALSSLLREARAPVPIGVTAAIVCQSLAGLHAAHEARDEAGRPLGMIHRDVSPQNILVGVDGLARITDFGIAKAASRLHVTLEKQIKGKLRYMAPEQITSDAKIDRRADVYAMGVVLWETLAGQRLFRGETVEQLLLSIIHDTAPSLADRRSDVPKALDDAIRKAVSRTAADRFATAEEFQIALERAVPSASARAVGEWVQAVSGAALAERRAIVDRIEQSAASRTSVAAQLADFSSGQGAAAGAALRRAPAEPHAATKPDGTPRAPSSAGEEATVVGPPPSFGDPQAPSTVPEPAARAVVGSAPGARVDPLLEIAPTVVGDTGASDSLQAISTTPHPGARATGPATLGPSPTEPTPTQPAPTEPTPTHPAPTQRASAGEGPSGAAAALRVGLTAVSGPAAPVVAAPTMVARHIAPSQVPTDTTVSGYIALPHSFPSPEPARAPKSRPALTVAVAAAAVAAAIGGSYVLLGRGGPSRPAGTLLALEATPRTEAPRAEPSADPGAAPSHAPAASTEVSVQASASAPSANPDAPRERPPDPTAVQRPPSSPKPPAKGPAAHVPSEDSL